LAFAGTVCAQSPPAPTLPINLATALQLAGERPLDVALATQRVQVAAAQLERAQALWWPTLALGVDYARHDGQLQDIVGQVFTTSRSSFFVGGGPTLNLSVSDALYAPLAARQIVQARQAEAQAARNDAGWAVAEAYFAVQQARGELAGATDTVRRAEEVARQVTQLAGGLAPALEANRSRAEVSRRRQSVAQAGERWQTASAELARVLRLPASAVLEPAEPAQLRVVLLDPATPVDDLIPLALTQRPELVARQAVVQATLARLKQEHLRPLVPSLVLRGNATNPSGTFSTGLFGGGVNDRLANFNGRSSLDAQLVWEFQNLGFGNRAAVAERRAERELAVLELFRVQDSIAAEVAQAHAQVKHATQRASDAEQGLREALELADKIGQSVGQTRRVGDVVTLVFRPQEVVAAVQALALAYDDYFRAIADANRAQFRLYRAIGKPAHCLVPLP
jgi:outer membrane protein TolC